MNRQIHLYDTTLRDGMQGEGISLSAAEKLSVARRSTGSASTSSRRASRARTRRRRSSSTCSRGALRQREICAFGMTRRRDLEAADDPALRILADCFAPVCTLVGKTWKLHLEKVIRADPDENLRLIADSVAYLRAQASG